MVEIVRRVKLVEPNPLARPISKMKDNHQPDVSMISRHLRR
jgi:hypothetical protein